MTDNVTIDAEVRAIREEYADEEAEAAGIEAAENAATLGVPASSTRGGRVRSRREDG